MTIKDRAWRIGQTVATNVFCVFSLLNWHLEVKLCASQCREHQMDIKGWVGGSRVGCTGRLGLTYTHCYVYKMDFPDGSDGKRIHLQCRRSGFHPWVGKILWRREWQPTPVFLFEEFQEQKSLEGYSPCGRKESDTTERLVHTHL